jgi:hypothetical protein
MWFFRSYWEAGENQASIILYYSLHSANRIERVGDWLRSRPWSLAVLSLLLVLSWQALTVRANCQGHWSGLFRTGRAMPLPPELAATTFRNPHPQGYDGQFYRILATDPFLRRDTAAYLDSPLLRSRRILIPLMTWVLAAGQVRVIDAAYVCVVAFFVGLGVHCMAKLMSFHGRHPALGLLFLLIPAVPIAVDSMTIDVSLAALAACFAYQVATGRTRWLWLTLAAATLSRETGALLPAAAAIAALLERTPRKALLWASATVPALGWYAYLYRVLPASALSEGFIPKWFIPRPTAGILLRTVSPLPYPLLGRDAQLAARTLDTISLVATIALVIVAILLLRKMRPVALQAATVLFVGLVVAATDRDFWNTPYGYARPIAPLFVLVLAGLGGLERKRLVLVAAVLLALLDLRILAEAETQAMGVLRLLAGG